MAPPTRQALEKHEAMVREWFRMLRDPNAKLGERLEALDALSSIRGLPASSCESREIYRPILVELLGKEGKALGRTIRYQIGNAGQILRWMR